MGAVWLKGRDILQRRKFDERLTEFLSRHGANEKGTTFWPKVF